MGYSDHIVAQIFQKPLMEQYLETRSRIFFGFTSRTYVNEKGLWKTVRYATHQHPMKNVLGTSQAASINRKLIFSFSAPHRKVSPR